jgi:hypothetical protein
MRNIVATAVATILVACSSNGSNTYTPSAAPNAAPVGSFMATADASQTKFVPSTVTLSNVLHEVSTVKLEGVRAADPPALKSNSCDGNVKEMLRGSTVTLELTKLFERYPTKGCTLNFRDGAKTLPLSVDIPAISFTALGLPDGSKLSGNVLKLPNNPEKLALDRALRISEPDVDGAFLYESESCGGESLLLAELLAPTISRGNDLKLNPVTQQIGQLTDGAICNVVVSDAQGRDATLIVDIPTQSP